MDYITRKKHYNKKLPLENYLVEVTDFQTNSMEVIEFVTDDFDKAINEFQVTRGGFTYEIIEINNE